MSRSARRQMEKLIGKESNEKLAEKIFQFNQLPQACSACTEPFDKTDKSALQSWSVVVRQETVRLFCPTCIQKTKEVLENVNQEQRNENR